MLLVHQYLRHLKDESQKENEEASPVTSNFRDQIMEIWRLNNIDPKDGIYKTKIKTTLMSAIPQNTSDVSRKSKTSRFIYVNPC